MIRTALLVTILGAMSVNAHAQETTRIFGKVVDMRGAPVRDATLELDKPGFPSVRTDSAGAFKMLNLVEGTYVVTVRAIGFAPKSGKVLTTKSRPAEIGFELENTAQQLAPVTVQERLLVPLEYRGTHRYDEFFENRYSNSGGTFYTRAELDSLGGLNAAIQRISGVKMLTGKNGRQYIAIQRCRPPGTVAFIVDGQIMSDGMDSVNPAEIETIEIYRGITGMPAKAKGNACAAVVINTK